MLDSIYKTVQAILNKDQLGYLKPLKFNLFIRNASRKIYNGYLTDLKSNVRKMNWMLDGKDFAKLSEHTQQLLEHFSAIEPITRTTNFVFPDDFEYVEDVFTGDTRIEKINYSDYQDLQSNNYAPPSTCNPICSKVGSALLVSPLSITAINLHYLREPKIANWTFEEVDGKPMFDQTANDYQDVDMPKSAYDELISLVVEMGATYLRDFNVVQGANAEQVQDTNQENKQ
jgi:hypothetical protein